MRNFLSSKWFGNRYHQITVKAAVLVLGSFLMTSNAAAQLVCNINPALLDPHFISSVISPGNGAIFTAPLNGVAIIPLRGSSRLVTNYDGQASPQCIYATLNNPGASFVIDGADSSATGTWSNGVLTGSVQLPIGLHTIGIRGASRITGQYTRYQYSDTITVNVVAGPVVPGPRNPGGPVGPIMGWADGFSNGGNTFSGWACDKNVGQSINVHLYLDAPPGQGGLGPLIITANQPREDAVGQACSTVGIAHGWVVDVTPYRAQYAGHRIFVYGISASGGPNLDLNNSGAFTIP